jgi:uncharacterized lipoprotein YddW (UPF0748 family)
MRGVWLTNIDSDVLFSRDRLETGIDRLAKLNFNTVYPTVWSWGYTLYPSQTAQLATGASQSLYPNFPGDWKAHWARKWARYAARAGHCCKS